MNVPSFSVVAIARNEARTLPILARSLERVSGGRRRVARRRHGQRRRHGAGGARSGRACRNGRRAVPFRAHGRAGRRHHDAIFARQGRPARRGRPDALRFRPRARVRQRTRLATISCGTSTRATRSCPRISISSTTRFGPATSIASSISCALGRSQFRVARFFDRRLYAWYGRIHEAPHARGAAMTERRVACDESATLPAPHETREAAELPRWPGARCHRRTRQRPVRRTTLVVSSAMRACLKSAIAVLRRPRAQRGRWPWRNGARVSV